MINKITKVMKLQIDDRQRRFKIQINGVFDGKNKENGAETNTNDLIKEKSP